MGNKLVLVCALLCFYSWLHSAGPTSDDLAVACTYRSTDTSARAGEREYYYLNRLHDTETPAAVASPWFNEAMRSALKPLEEEVARLVTKVDGLNAKVYRLDAKVDRLNAKVNRLDAKVDGLDAKVDGLDARR